MAALIAAAAISGCASQVTTTLPDASTMPARGDLASERARAQDGMRDLAQKKAEQAETVKEIQKSR